MIPGEYSDIFNESHYQELMLTELIVEGVHHGIIYFQQYNIALSLISVRLKIPLCAFILTKIADMQALKVNQYLKGPDACSPCQTSLFQGCCDPDHKNGKNYYPLQKTTRCNST